ncbi:MAG: T9SS type A sorting domain-containing protein [candidate division Zixibacteria bacterium]|nr:T9SS type A sorting domain-containing protein [candidate division Zixibacteria bacterium]
MRITAIIIITCLLSVNILLSDPAYVGFSGAPTANGTCSNSCHAQDAFTPSCEIIGFPAIYVHGEQYTITVRKDGFQAIKQFNCSVRKDSDSTNAGLLEAGFATEAYSTTNETNGIHWVSADTDSGNFIWTAPEISTGHVTLYWACLQGKRAFGANQEFAIKAFEEGNSIDFISDLPRAFKLDQNYPNPFNSATTISLQISQPGDVILDITNILGQLIQTVSIPRAQPGQYSILWSGFDKDGRDLPSGLYFYQLKTPEGELTRKMTILR